jgi:hypothetical protein
LALLSAVRFLTNGEPLIGETIRQVADFPQLVAGGWRLEADCSV